MNIHGKQPRAAGEPEPSRSASKAGPAGISGASHSKAGTERTDGKGNPSLASGMDSNKQGSVSSGGSFSGSGPGSGGMGGQSRR